MREPTPCAAGATLALSVLLRPDACSRPQSISLENCQPRNKDSNLEPETSPTPQKLNPSRVLPNAKAEPESCVLPNASCHPELCVCAPAGGHDGLEGGCALLQRFAGSLDLASRALVPLLKQLLNDGRGCSAERRLACYEQMPVLFDQERQLWQQVGTATSGGRHGQGAAGLA